MNGATNVPVSLPTATRLASRIVRAATTLRTDRRYETAACESAMRAEASLFRSRGNVARFHAADSIYAEFMLRAVSS